VHEQQDDDGEHGIQQEARSEAAEERPSYATRLLQLTSAVALRYVQARVQAA
jgi:hypothetical protein